MIWHWYGFFIGLAGVVGYSIAEKLEPKISRGVGWIIAGAFIGARLYHVIDLWEYYSQNLGQIIALWQGGLGIWGGIVGGGVGLVIANHKFSNSQMERSKILGAIVTALPLSQAIGRVGNGVNGEFVNKIWILPWWSVEAILDLVLFALLWRLPIKSRLGAYLFGYGMIRFVLEYYRENNWQMWGLGVAQWASLGAIVIGLAIWQLSVQD